MSNLPNAKERMEAFNACCPLSRDTTAELAQWLKTHGFFTNPASTKYHGAYPGGLFDHSFEVAMRLKMLTADNHLTWTRPESPFIVGMFHDLCKTDQYTYEGIEDNKPIYAYSTDTTLQGHGDKSVMLLSTLMRLTEEEMLCIRYHMGAFTDKEEWSKYTNAIHRYPNVLWTHQADMLAAHVYHI